MTSYQILFTDVNGHNVRRPVHYNIDVDPDLSPEVEIVEPQSAGSGSGRRMVNYGSAYRPSIPTSPCGT